MATMQIQYREFRISDEGLEDCLVEVNKWAERLTTEHVLNVETVFLHASGGCVKPVALRVWYKA